MKAYLVAPFTAVCAIAYAGFSSAGGYIAPVRETPIIAAPITQPTTDWSGSYVGGALGYSFGADDDLGFDSYLDRLPAGEPDQRVRNLGDVDVKGVTGQIHLGYRWQRDRWVFGPELSLEGGSVDDVYSGAEGLEVKSEVNYVASLVMKTGYTVSPQTLLYSMIGFTHGDFDYSLDDGEEGEYSARGKKGYSANGYAVGLGVERKMNDRLSVFAEWQYRNFGGTDITFLDRDEIPEDDHIVTRATPEHHNVKVGVNFKF